MSKRNFLDIPSTDDEIVGGPSLDLTIAILSTRGQETIYQLLTTTAPTQGAQWIGRHRDDANCLSIIQPDQPCPLADQMSLPNLSRNDCLPALCDCCFHFSPPI